MLGAYGVGKTSLVRRFVYSIFSESYLSTIGVKIDRKQLVVDGQEVTLMLWDVAGEEDAFQIPLSYIAGATGYLLVIDGTRPETFETAIEITERINGELDNLPMVALCNKADLTEDWKLSAEQLALAEERGWTVLITSAKTGENVEEAFAEIARQVL